MEPAVKSVTNLYLETLAKSGLRDGLRDSELTKYYKNMKDTHY